jgi:dihydrofolate reductase
MSKLAPFCAVAALDQARGLGLKGDLPWHLPEDLKHFARTTKQTDDPEQQNAVIMGRVTCETIPPKYWPLPGRRNAVITRNPDWKIEGADVYNDLETAVTALQDQVEKVFVVGGGQIYSLALELEACRELILTRILKDFECDAFFPPYEDRFHLAEEIGRGAQDGLEYIFERWVRNES